MSIEKVKGDDDVSSGPKPKWCYSDWWLLGSISDSDSDDEGVNHLDDDLMACCDTPCEPDLKPPVKIGSFHVPHYLEAFVEKMTSATGSYHDNTNSVLVTNLPYYVKTNSDLAELCNPFGDVTSVDVAIDHEFGCNGHFGFVSFSTRDGAQNAINNLNGYFCINAAIGVQWVTPKTTF